MGQTIELFCDVLIVLNESEGMTEEHIRIFMEAAECFYLWKIIGDPRGLKSEAMNLMSSMWDMYHPV